MNYRKINKIKGRIFNKVTRALHQNNLLMNLFHTTRHSERSEESFNEILRAKALRMTNTNITTCIASHHNHFLTNLFPYSPSKKKAAFTLAEVLITLGIIGVVAALTIPTLTANYKKKVLINQNKQAYSLIINALDRTKTDSQTYSYDIFASDKTVDEVTELFSKYFKTTGEEVDSYKYKQMRPTINISDANKYDTGKTFPRNNFRTTNGMLVGITKFDGCIQQADRYVYNPDGTVARDENGIAITESYEREACADIIIDVNGEKEPNQAGKDIFRFTIQRNTYEISNTSAYGNIKYIIQHNDFDPNIIDYELGGDKS